MPYGLKIILWYTTIIAFFQLIIGIFVPFSYPGISLLIPTINLFNAIFFLICLVIVYGLLKKKIWAYKLILIWYFVSIFYNFFYFFFSYDIFDIMADVLFVGLVFSFLVNCTVIWYLMSQKEYFKHHGIFHAHQRIRFKEIEANDYVFMNVFFAFWVVTVIVLIFSGAKLMNDTFEISNDVISKITETGFYDSSICADSDLKYSDACYMTFGVIKKDNSYCSAIISPFYKFTCYLGA